MRGIIRFLLLAFILAARPAYASRPVEFAEHVPRAGALVLPLSAPADLNVRGAALDVGVRAAIARGLEGADFDYAFGHTVVLYGVGTYPRILIIGTGSLPLDERALTDLSGIAGRETVHGWPATALLADGLVDPPSEAAALGLGASLGSYTFDIYRAETRGIDPPSTQTFMIVLAGADAARQAYRERYASLAHGVGFARDLVTEPANVIYPETFVDRTRAVFRSIPNVSIEVLDVAAMERLGMQALLGVGRGSSRPPRLLIVEYRGDRSRPLIVLAGKGITFDSGGISIKPREGLWRQKQDMAGAAAVMGALLALAERHAPVNVVAVAALAENMPDGGAQRPGDVVRANNGRTIEIINTDAEGRLVLADAVSYAARRYNPAALIDVATLTGAIRTALGPEYAGLFTQSDALAAQLLAAGRSTGEEVWRLHVHPAYAERMRSPIADIRNMVEDANPGAGLAAYFLSTFVPQGTPWAHLDIAGTAWSDDDLPASPAGATGYSVRLLERFVRDFRPTR